MDPKTFKLETKKLAVKHKIVLGHLHDIGGQELHAILSRFDALVRAHEKLVYDHNELKKRRGNMQGEIIQKREDATKRPLPDPPEDTDGIMKQGI